MTKRPDDPRTPAQRAADADVQRALDRGTFPQWPVQAREAAIDLARKKKDARRIAAALGLGLSALRRCVGLSQEDVAHRVGTQRTAISRLESGRYGGITVEKFLLVLDAISQYSLQARLTVGTCSPGEFEAQLYDDKALEPESSHCA